MGGHVGGCRQCDVWMDNRPGFLGRVDNEI